MPSTVSSTRHVLAWQVPCRPSGDMWEAHRSDVVESPRWEWQSWDLNPGGSAPQSSLLTAAFCRVVLQRGCLHAPWSPPFWITKQFTDWYLKLMILKSHLQNCWVTELMKWFLTSQNTSTFSDTSKVTSTFTTAVETDLKEAIKK